MTTVSAASLATIGAVSVRWPDTSAVQWTAMRQAIADAREAVATVGEAVDAANGDRDLSDQGRARRINSAALSPIARLDALPSLARAERLVAEFLENQSQRRPTPIRAPATVNDVQVAAEIRQWVSRQKSPLQGAMTNATDAVVMSAVLTASGFLSGLTAEQTNRAYTVEIHTRHGWWRNSPPTPRLAL